MTAQPPRRQVFLEGTYGIGNLGDDLLAVLFTRALDAWGCDVILAGDQTLGRTQEVAQIDVHRTDIWGKFKALRRTRLAVIGGGGQFNDNSSRTGGAHLAITFALCRLLGRRVLVCGTGFGPLRRRPARAIWQILGRSPRSAFALREVLGQQSFQALTGRKAVLSFDPIFSDFAATALSIDALRAQRQAAPPAADAPGLVNFRSFRRNTFVEQTVLAQIAVITNAPLTGLSVDDRGDLDLDALTPYGITQLHPYRGVDLCLSQINAAPFVVTQRFHVLCACALLGVPVVPVCYADKMQDFCRWMGMPFVTTEDTDADAIRSAVEACLAAGPVDLSRLHDRVDPLAWLSYQICKT